MKLPWVSRAHFECLSEQLDLQRELIETLRQQNAELKALFSKTSQFEVVEQDSDGVKLKMKSGPSLLAGTGRGGFRSQRIAGEAQTKPAPADSAEALNRRVAAAKTKQHETISQRLAD